MLLNAIIFISSDVVVTLTNLTKSDTDTSSAVAGVRLNTDGTLDSNGGFFYVQVNASTDWVIPNESASGIYEVRATQISSTGSGTRTGTLGTFESLGSEREWWARRVSGAGDGTDEWVIDLEIRKGTGPVLSTGRFTLQATITSI